MMENWTSYQTRAIQAEERLAEEKERVAKVLQDLEAYKLSLQERVTAAETAETRVKGHLWTSRQKKECK